MCGSWPVRLMGSGGIENWLRTNVNRLHFTSPQLLTFSLAENFRLLNLLSWRPVRWANWKTCAVQRHFVVLAKVTNAETAHNNEA
jgi:hypothetical protein